MYFALIKPKGLSYTTRIVTQVFRPEKDVNFMLNKIKQPLNKFLTWSTESASNLILTSVIFFILGISIASIFLKNHFENFYFFVVCCVLVVFLVLFWPTPSSAPGGSASGGISPYFRRAETGGEKVGVNSRKWISLSLFCLIFLIFGFWRYDFSLPKFQIDEIKTYNGQTVDFVGTISDEPDKRSDHIKLTVEVEGVFLPPLSPPISPKAKQGELEGVFGKVLLRAPLYPEYKYGDTLEISCKINAPENFNDFDYAAYLSRYGIYSVCNFPKEIKLLKSGGGGWFYGPIFSLKNKLADIGAKILPEPHASFLAALLYGARQGIPEEINEQFNRVALTHVIAISGYNISLVVGILLPFFLLIFIPRRFAFPLVVLGIVFFVIFTGASASVARAGIMGIIAALANNNSRMSQSGRILVFVGFLMLCQNPKLLFFDRGFSLSFAATAGLIYFVPVVKNYFFWWRRGVYFRKIIEETLSATIATLPLTIYYFDRISLVSVLANLFVLPMIPMIMLFGFISLIGGLIWQGLGFILAVIPWILINYVFKIIEFFASFKLASVDLGKVPWLVPVILYGVLFAWMMWVKRPKQCPIKPEKSEADEYEIIDDT